MTADGSFCLAVWAEDGTENMGKHGGFLMRYSYTAPGGAGASEGNFLSYLAQEHGIKPLDADGDASESASIAWRKVWNALRDEDMSVQRVPEGTARILPAVGCRILSDPSEILARIKTAAATAERYTMKVRDEE